MERSNHADDLMCDLIHIRDDKCADECMIFADPHLIIYGVTAGHRCICVISVMLPLPKKDRKAYKTSC